MASSLAGKASCRYLKNNLIVLSFDFVKCPSLILSMSNKMINPFCGPCVLKHKS